MPTILREQGFRVVIYPNDHLPSHVHVFKGSGEVRIELGDEESDPRLMTITGQISDEDVAKALYLATENQAKLLAKWREIHE
jgi:Domain of unknown function (DUF4160)